MNRYIVGLLSQNNATYKYTTNKYVSKLGDLFLEIVRLAQFVLKGKWSHNVVKLFLSLIFTIPKFHTVLSKGWSGKKVTIYYPIFLLVKSSENILFFYLHFSWIVWLKELPKNFEKMAILKIGELVSF